MLFNEFRSHRIAALSSEAGEPFTCFADPKGLPNKLIYHPVASDFFPGREDEPSDLDVKMRLVAAQSGNALDTYLTETLGLQKDVDFTRHANSERGGRIYFDMKTDHAIDTLNARAAQRGAESPVERAQRDGGPSSHHGR